MQDYISIVCCICAEPPNCQTQCVPGKYGLYECIYDCIVSGYDYGTCNPNPSGKCCCAHEGHDR